MEESQVVSGNLNPDVVVGVSHVGQMVCHRILRASNLHGPLEVPFFQLRGNPLGQIGKEIPGDSTLRRLMWWLSR